MTGEQDRILVVDDEESVRNLLQWALAEVGYNVVTAANGEEALDKVSQLKIGTLRRQSVYLSSLTLPVVTARLALFKDG
jgi:CheY-like chemotaxis protein